MWLSKKANFHKQEPGGSVHFLSKWPCPNPEAKEQLRRHSKGQKLAGIRMKENAH